jgi:hypothetical protein
MLLLLRILIPLATITIFLGFLAYALTRKQRYLVLALRLLKISLFVILLFFGLLFLERLVFVPL